MVLELANPNSRVRLLLFVTFIMFVQSQFRKNRCLPETDQWKASQKGSEMPLKKQETISQRFFIE